MNNSDISVSKIVGSPNEHAWSQASSTGKLYVVISLYSEKEDSGIVSIGKNALEQIQREFFALDEKKLEDIKGVAEKVFSSLDPNVKYSAVIASITTDILYIVTVSDGIVVLNRENNLAEIARGEEGEIIGFSGRLKNNDVIIIESNEFNKKISNKLLAEYTGTTDNEKIAEDIAPFILEDSKGQEAAIIIKYKNEKDATAADKEEADDVESEPQEERREENDTDFEEKKNHEEKNIEESQTDSKKALFGFLPKFNNPLGSFSKKQKRIFIFAAIIVFLIVASLFAERFMEAQRVKTEEFNTVYEQSSEGLENAKDLATVNRGRALEETNQAIQNIETNFDKFSEGSDEHEQLSELLAELNSLRDELGGGSEIAGNVIFEASDSEILDDLDQISYSNGNLVVSGGNGYSVINEKGEIDSEQELSDLDFKDSISDDTYLYLLGDSVNRITISTGNTNEIIEGSGDNIDISYFGTNVYLLNREGEVTRYSGSSYQGTSYFNDNADLIGNAVSFAIDSSIYVLSENGTINKYTRGENDSEFELDESVKPSKNTLLYSNEELDHFYILDINNATITQITSEGSVSSKFNSLDLQNASAFTVNNDESSVFVVIDNQVYSYDL